MHEPCRLSYLGKVFNDIQGNTVCCFIFEKDGNSLIYICKETAGELNLEKTCYNST
jgi:hypothetical protein